jgi:drug/metabolite transporter (DMT)-like permease
MHFTNDQKGSVLAILSGLLYGLIAYFAITILAEKFTIYNMLFWRFIISSAFIGLIIIYKTKLGFRRISFKKILPYIYSAILQSFGVWLYIESSLNIGSGLSTVIFFTYPVMLIIFNWFWHNEKAEKIYYFSIALSIVGMIFLSDYNSNISFYGMALALLSALCYTIYIMLNKHVSSSLPPLTATFIISIVISVIFFFLSLTEENFIIPHTLSTWTKMIAIGVFATAIPLLMLLKSMEYISSAKASLLSVLEPVCVTVLGVLLLEEQITLLQWLGIVTILVGAMLVQIDKKKPITQKNNGLQKPELTKQI